MERITTFSSIEKSEKDNETLTTRFTVSDKLIKKAYWFLVITGGMTVLFNIVAKISVFSTWDDGFMFPRYAENFINYKTISWNPGAEPTYGLTSPAFLVLAVPLRLFTGYNPGFITVMQSLLCGLLFLVILFYLLAWHIQTSRVIRAILVLTTIYVLALNSTNLTIHFNNGFDTTFGMAYVALYILLWKRFEKKSSLFNLLVVGVLGGLSFWVRPDSVVFVIAAPCALLVLGRGKERKQAFGLLTLTGLVLGGVLLTNYFYFKTALPLPFYAKTSDLYGIDIQYEYSKQQGLYFLNFLQQNGVFFLLIAFNIFFNFGTFWRKTTPGEKGFLGAIGVVLLYYCIFVLPIMGMNERYNQITLPALIFLACINGAQLMEVIYNRFLSNVEKVKSFARIPSVVGLGVLIVGQILVTPHLFYSLKMVQNSVEQRTFLNFQVNDFYYINGSNLYWRRLAEITTLPDDLVIAAADVGIVGIMGKNKVIVDTAGLNTPEFTQKKFPVNTLVEKYHPDFIYSNAGYKNVTNAYRTDPEIIKNYDYYVGTEVKGAYFYDVLIRKSSPYYEPLSTIIKSPYTKQEFLPNNVVEQRFIARSDNLWRVILPILNGSSEFSDKNLAENCTLSVKVMEVASNKILSQYNRPCNIAVTREDQFLTFKPIPDSKGKEYKVVITASGSKVGSAPGTWKTSVPVSYSATGYYVAGDLVPGGLDLQVHYDLMGTYRTLLFWFSLGAGLLGLIALGWFYRANKRKKRQQLEQTKVTNQSDLLEKETAKLVANL